MLAIHNRFKLIRVIVLRYKYCQNFIKQGGAMKKQIISAILLVFISSPVFAFGKVEKNPVTIYEKINPAIVTVDSQIQDGLSCGTGCIIDKSGIILTSAHVIDIGNTVVVTMSNGQNYDAKVLKHLGSNKDIALLKIDAKKDLKTVKLGDSAKVKVGQKVLAIGNPFGFSGTLTQGIVSRIDYAKNRIQTDAAINPGLKMSEYLHELQRSCFLQPLQLLVVHQFLFLQQLLLP